VLTEKQENILYDLLDQVDNKVISLKKLYKIAIEECYIDYYDIELFIEECENG